MLDLDDKLINLMLNSFREKSKKWVQRNCIFGNGKDKKRVQLCSVNGEIINDISHLKIR